jgi:hypothetical protein
LRDNEPVYAELGLKDRALEDDALIAIVVAGHKAAIGRPPEKVLEIL